MSSPQDEQPQPPAADMRVVSARYKPDVDERGQFECVKNDAGVSFVSAQGKYTIEMMNQLIQATQLHEPVLLKTPLVGMMMVRGLQRMSTRQSADDADASIIYEERLLIILCNQTRATLTLCQSEKGLQYRTLMFSSTAPIPYLRSENGDSLAPMVDIECPTSVMNLQDMSMSEFDAQTIDVITGKPIEWLDSKRKKRPTILRSRFTADIATMLLLGMAGSIEKRGSEAGSYSVSPQPGAQLLQKVLLSNDTKTAPHLLYAFMMSVPRARVCDYFESLKKKHKIPDIQALAADMLRCLREVPPVGPYTGVAIVDGSTFLESLDEEECHSPPANAEDLVVMTEVEVNKDD